LVAARFSVLSWQVAHSRFRMSATGGAERRSAATTPFCCDITVYPAAA
jgi:hypothetical protein